MAALLNAGINGQRIDLWVVGGIQYLDCVNKIVGGGLWPGLKAVILGGTYSAPNISSSLLSSSDLRFMQGYLCALASKTGTVGFVATSPRTNNAIWRGLTAFSLGAKRAKPDITVAAALTSTFESPIAGRKATLHLIEEANADCIATQLNDLTVSVWASDRDRYSLGFGTDARFFVDENVLLSLLYNWTVATLPYYEAVLNDTWETTDKTRSTNSFGGGLTLSGYSTLVTDEWRTEVDLVLTKFRNQTMPLYCLPYWNDTQYMNASSTFIRQGFECMNLTFLLAAVGIPNTVEVVLEYTARNSPYRYVWITYTFSGSIFMLIITSLLMVWALGIGIHMIRHREHQVYRASSPSFLFLILLGVVLIASSIYFRFGRRSIVYCMAPWWFFGLGFALVFSCVCAKNWRVWKIFTSRRLQSRAILDIHLLTRWVVSYMVLEIIMLVIWSVVDPLLPTYSRSPLLDYDEVQIICSSALYGQTLLIIFTVFNLFLLAPVAVVAYLSRSAKGEYDEARPMGVILYATITIEVILFLVSFGISPHYQISFFIYCGMAWLPSAVILAAYFTPKVIRLRSANSAMTPSDNAIDMSGLKSFNSEMTGGFLSVRSAQGNQSLRTPPDSMAERIPDADPPPD